MEDTINRLASNLKKAIAKAIEKDSGVEACYEAARKEGFEMKLSLEAIIGFASYSRMLKSSKTEALAVINPPADKREFGANDKLFLGSIKIAGDEKAP
jgi:hypothetical protein